MSAYLCGDKHIAALARAIRIELAPIVPGRDEPLTEDEIATALTVANLDSLAARYPNDPPQDGTRAPGFVSQQLRGAGVARVHGGAYGDHASIDPVRLMKAIDCFCYQACETDAWEESTECGWLQELRKRASTRVSGYEAAEWGAPFPIVARNAD